MSKRKREEKNLSHLDHLSKEEIISSSHLPINLACITLKTDVEELKKKCREMGIKRWPYSAKKEIKKVVNTNKIEKKGVRGMFMEFSTCFGSPTDNVLSLNDKRVLLPSLESKNLQTRTELPSFSELTKILIEK